jgi:hypothetical protein
MAGRPRTRLEEHPPLEASRTYCRASSRPPLHRRLPKRLPLAQRDRTASPRRPRRRQPQRRHAQLGTRRAPTRAPRRPHRLIKPELPRPGRIASDGGSWGCSRRTGAAHASLESAPLTRSTIPWMPGADPSIAPADVRVGEHLPAGDRGPRAGEALQLCLARVQKRDSPGTVRGSVWRRARDGESPRASSGAEGADRRCGTRARASAASHRPALTGAAVQSDRPAAGAREPRCSYGSIRPSRIA